MRELWNTLKTCSRRFRKDEPGHRFLHAHDGCRGKGRSFLTNFIFIGLGVVLIALGALLGLVPGVPGIVLAVFGFALISTRIRWMAVALDWLEVKIRKLIHRLNPWKGTHRR
jgi:hypothetical protein